MKKSFNKKTLCLAGTALLLTAGLSVDLGMTTTVPDETVDNWTKHVTVQNTGNYDCFVRVRAFAGAQYQDGLTYSGNNWSLADDGYYYYSQIVEAGTSTEDALDIRIPHENADQDFNVIVVQECAPVIYDESGNPAGDWDHILDSTQDSYDGNEEVGE